MTEPDLVRWYREQLETYAAQLAIRDKQLAQVQRALDAANATIADMRAMLPFYGYRKIGGFLVSPVLRISRDQYATETASWDGPPEPPSGSV
jgi:multidrug efflux pump subunit AcrA (membrane-fusion protein)